VAVDLAVLVEQCRVGDELAWEAFVRQFQGRIYAIASAYASGHEDGRDLAQDVFVRLYEKRRLWPDAGVFVPWMIRTARNLCIDRVRMAQARPQAHGASDEILPRLVDAAADPEAASISAGRTAAVWRAMKHLTDISREIIVLRDIQGLSIEEVSAALEVPVGTIKSRSNRARIELARILGELGFRPQDRPSGGA
jgi:RNA polymerase sigma-70 factor, ECF subfamily